MSSKAITSPLQTSTKNTQLKQRIYSIDMLRGLAIIFMALDHIRDYWSPAPFQPEDLSQASPELFLTRWITHFCAPIFVLLTGVSAYLYGQKTSKKALTHFLITRGIWLIAVELLINNPAWRFDFSNVLFVQVIWALGWSMIALAGVIWLNRYGVIVLTAVVLLGHNALDSLKPEVFGSMGWLWQILHVRSFLPFSFLPTEKVYGFYIAYPLIPWLGVAMLGYLIGPVFLQSNKQRSSFLLSSGVLLIGLFLVLRLTGLYGDPSTWQVIEGQPIRSLLEILNTAKYPPSLQYLCMTIGPSLLLLVLLEKCTSESTATLGMTTAKGTKLTGWQNILLVFGRVPMFFYLIHVPIINAASHVWTWWQFGEARNMMFGRGLPEGYEPSLLRAYLVWITLCTLLYFACKWFGQVKKQYDWWWLKYL